MNFVLQQYLRTSQHKFIESRFYRTFSFNSRHLFKNLCSTNESRMPSDDFSDSLTKFTGFIPMKEIEITHCRSSGSGGQSVNKLNSKVNLRFHVKSASWLCNELKEKLFEKHNTKINKDGYMIIKSELTNSQQLNKADAFRKLRQIIRDLIVVPKEPSELTKEKHRKNKLVESQERIFTKRIRSQIKQNRQGLNFTEIMRVLGYPRLISLSNFKHPSFPLVREILVWFIRRFDCDNKHHVSIVLGTEEERITFISHAAEFMIRTVNIQINIKNLYMADVKALEELFNLASLLHEAQLQNTNELIRFENRQIANFNISERLNDLKTIRQIASLVTINGAALYDQLVGETDLRGISNAKIAYQYDSIEIELAIKEIIELLKKGTEETKNHIKNLKDTEHNLEFRIERREIELDRNKKRLQTLKKVRPAFMEELDKLEIALKDLYHDYLQKFRYLAYLEHLYEDAAKVEQERFERRQAATKKQLEQLRIDDANIDSIIECNESILNTNLPNSFPFEGGKKTTENISQDFKKSNRTNISHRKLYGSMSGHHNKNVREVNAGEESSDSDSDLLIDNIDDDDEDDELHSIDPKGSEFPEEKRAISKIDYADDEF